ncbi:unnamed protein product [Vicia faba]|uniref:Uncharacterized protein n=1 Tax=Vicia faba TaxID=3906 RepID=A0AAV1AUV9_VICFA|nr:unnamed protein product [Vicia faba]
MRGGMSEVRADSGDCGDGCCGVHFGKRDLGFVGDCGSWERNLQRRSERGLRGGDFGGRFVRSRRVAVVESDWVAVQLVHGGRQGIIAVATEHRREEIGSGVEPELRLKD